MLIFLLYSLTGESEPVRKSSSVQAEKADASLFDLENICFMGTGVVSGSGAALVLRTGDGELYCTWRSKAN
jgi:P-type Mg2+ transporter